MKIIDYFFRKLSASGIYLHSDYDSESQIYLRYDECSGFQIVEEFEIAEYESFLIVSKLDLNKTDYCINKNRILDIVARNKCELNGYPKKRGIPESFGGIVFSEENLRENNYILEQINLSATCKNFSETACINSSLDIFEKDEFKLEVFTNNSVHIPFTNRLENPLNDKQKELESTKLRSESIDSKLLQCTTPSISSLKTTVKLKNDRVCLTPDRFHVNPDDKLCLNKDFNKSDIILLLRLKRRKLAMLESQLERDLNLLKANDSVEVGKEASGKDGIFENMTACPAQLHYIKRRIDIIKENIEITEKDIVILEENTLGTF
ncbi:hypothetical protein HWI79_1141 [Cryptosporidium felis]|nr:hypothetical protein HWI79_1141 [Cryptosporidium felis]